MRSIHRMAVLLAAVPIAAALLLGGFQARSGAGGKAVPPAARLDPRTSRSSEEGDPGRASYLRYCSGCHGVKGDGGGPAAVFLFPKPRDFTSGTFKFGSRPGGLPLEEDLMRTITRGLHGTSMPGWALVPEAERRALIRTIKGFSPAWTEITPPPPVPVYRNPYDLEDAAALAQAVKLGERVYHVTATCWSCHPAYLAEAQLKELLVQAGKLPNLRPNIERVELKPDRWGQEIPPPDFPRARLKSVDDLQDLYRVIMNGVGGTAMPSWEDALKPEEIWALTLYVDSIRKGGSVPGKQP